MDKQRFIHRYLLLLALLFVLTQAPFHPLSSILNNFHTDLTVELLRPFLPPGRLQGIDIWINPHYKIYISHRCNALVPIVILFAAIIAYEATLKRKIVWLGVGYIVFQIVNTLRILLVVFITRHGEGKKEFFWSHDLLGNALLMATGLMLFYLFTRKTKG